MSQQLQPFIIANLYKNSLVLTDEIKNKPESLTENNTDKSKKIDTPIPAEEKKWFFGDNKKNIVMLLNDDSAIYINDAWLETLSKMLAACNLNLSDIAIVNYAQHNIPFARIKEQLQPQIVFMFDVSTQDIELPFTIPHYQLQNYAGCTFITAPSITLSSEKNDEQINIEKRKLWNKMKSIFAI